VERSGDAVYLDARRGGTDTAAFIGIPESVWAFRVGGYQVCEKWLKDRRGRTLSSADIAQYRRIVATLDETIRLMSRVDTSIMQHGGWPGAFETTTGEELGTRRIAAESEGEYSAGVLD
jgi:hypothetical protein